MIELAVDEPIASPTSISRTWGPFAPSPPIASLTTAGGRAIRACTLLAMLAAGCEPNTPEGRLLHEFRGAYPGEAKPNGVVRAFDVTAAPTEVTLANGVTTRVWAYNGQVPGPTLRVRLGETLRVRFTNRLPQPTTIHWHGVRVPNRMDGVPGVTQPAVAPGDTFIYEFTPKDAGTFWFHPHVRSSEQVERGLYGVLIIEDPAPAPYARDVVWVLDDWLLDREHQVYGQFNTRHDLAHDGRWGNLVTVNGRANETLSVAPGERLRLRLLNAANGRVFAPDFSVVNARVIAVDGLYLPAPMVPGRFELAPGNRLDLDVTVAGTTGSRVAIADHFLVQRPNHLADLVLEGQATATADFPSPARAHVPQWKEGLSIPIRKEFRLNARRGGDYGIEWTFNDEAFAGHQSHDAALTLQPDTWSRLRFVNESYRLHPIHLHGMFFRLLARNGQPVDEPFFRDTVLVHGRESIDIGVVPLDEGAWMMHCHILEHAEAGMMTLIAVKAG